MHNARVPILDALGKLSSTLALKHDLKISYQCRAHHRALMFQALDLLRALMRLRLHMRKILSVYTAYLSTSP